MNFLLKDLNVSKPGTVIIGHRIGALATLKAMEQCKIKGAILITACTKYFGDEDENRSGFYDAGKYIYI